MGAAYSAALPDHLLTTRHALMSIGIAWDELYKKKHHKNSKATIDPHDGLKRVPRCTKWFFKKVLVKQ